MLKALTLQNNYLHNMTCSPWASH